jgi:hypothetical protein
MFYVLNCLLSNGCSIPESPCVGSSLPHVVLQHCILHVVSGFPGRVSSLLLAVLILGFSYAEPGAAAQSKVFEMPNSRGCD